MANTLNLGTDGNWATKEDSLLAYNSENGNFKPLPFDFTRASSATVVNKAGLIETVGSGEPRIDFSNDAKGALLLEATRSNLVLTSASGTYGNPPASETNTISPDGTNNAVIPIPDAVANRYQYSVSSGAYATNTKLAYSWYRKRISTPIDESYIGDLRATGINLTHVGDTEQIESNINGYDRFVSIINITDGCATTTIRFYFGNSIGVGNSSVAYFGHQLEQGSYATSYIPTQGSAVTRVADNCNNGGNEQVINSTQGVLYAQISALSDSGDTYRLIGLNNGSGTNTNRIFIGYTNNNSIYAAINDTTIAFTVSSFDVKNFNKVAVVYNGSIAKLFINGSEVGSGITNAPTLSGLSRVDFSGSSTGANEFKGNTKDVRVYNTALTDAELIALTKQVTITHV